MSIKGAIFDMDGTLLDSMGIWSTLGERYLRGKGKEPEQGLMDKLWTMSLAKGAEYIRQQYGIEDPGDVIVKDMYKLTEDFYREAVEEKPGIRLVLEDLQKAGIPMCVASATDTYLIEYGLERAGLRQYFQRVFCCREVQAGKESDRIYQAAREHMGTPVQETWVFEDALFAAETAKKSGFPVVAIRDEWESRQEELRELADIYLADYREWPGVNSL